MIDPLLTCATAIALGLAIRFHLANQRAGQALDRAKRRSDFFRDWATRATEQRIEAEAALDEMRIERDSAIREVMGRAS